MTASFKHFQNLDRKLAWQGFPKLSAWHLEQFKRFLDHPTARELVERVGRGGQKSTALTRFGCSETLFGAWNIAKGERHFFAFVSVSKDEASQRLTLLEAYLRALGVPFDRAGDTIDLKNLPRGFKVFAAQIGAVSGFRCYGYGIDEATKMRSGDDGANPVAEIVASLRAMTITHPKARGMIVSSPLALGDFHSTLIDAGDTERQLVGQAPSWVANTFISEQQTHELEPDRRVWKREYLAVPQAGALSAFDEEDIKRAFRPCGDIAKRSEPVLVLDMTSGKKDTLACGLGGWGKLATGSHKFLFDEVWGYGPKDIREHGIDAIVAVIARKSHAAGVSSAFGDQREAMMVDAALAKHGIDFHELAWTPSNKPRGVARVRRWLLEGTLALPQHEGLRRELLNFEERIDTGGQFTFGARGSGHDDYVSLLITAALADEAGKLSGSPLSETPEEVLRMIDELNATAEPRGKKLAGYGDSHPWYNRVDPTLPSTHAGNDTRFDALGRALGRRGGSNGWGGF